MYFLVIYIFYSFFILCDSNFVKQESCPSLGEDEEKRMIGGRNVTIQETPYQVALLWSECDDEEACEAADDRRLVCGGGLITYSTVITAANCFFKSDRIISYAVRAGSNMWSSGGEVRRISEVILHDGRPRGGWKAVNYTAYVDLALVIVRLPFTEGTDAIMPLDIPYQDADVSEGWNVTVAGWGQTRIGFVGNDHFPVYLLKNSYKVISVNECRNRTVEPDSPLDVSPSHHACINYVRPKHRSGPGCSMCDKDEGNPLVRGNELIAVYSFKSHKCNIYFPAVFTKLGPFFNWIVKNRS